MYSMPCLRCWSTVWKHSRCVTSFTKQPIRRIRVSNVLRGSSQGTCLAISTTWTQLTERQRTWKNVLTSCTNITFLWVSIEPSGPLRVSLYSTPLMVKCSSFFYLLHSEKLHLHTLYLRHLTAYLCATGPWGCSSQSSMRTEAGNAGWPWRLNPLVNLCSDCVIKN